MGRERPSDLDLCRDFVAQVQKIFEHQLDTRKITQPERSLLYARWCTLSAQKRSAQPAIICRMLDQSLSGVQVIYVGNVWHLTDSKAKLRSTLGSAYRQSTRHFWSDQGRVVAIHKLLQARFGTASRYNVWISVRYTVIRSEQRSDLDCSISESLLRP